MAWISLMNGLQPHIFISHPHVNLRSALATSAIVSIQGVTLSEDKFNSILYEAAAKGIPKVFFIFVYLQADA